MARLKYSSIVVRAPGPNRRVRLVGSGWLPGNASEQTDGGPLVSRESVLSLYGAGKEEEDASARG